MQYHKFKAKPTDVDNIKFASRKEARYYAELKLRQRNGEVLFFLRQVPFHLTAGVKYICDFQVFLADGTIEFVDVKGYITPTCTLKVKQVESLYPVTIKYV